MILPQFRGRQALNSSGSHSGVKGRPISTLFPEKRVKRRNDTFRRASYSNSSSSESSRSILEVFYYGRAFAETLNAKLGAMVEDVLSDIGKQSAESSQALREFQEEVEERAQRELDQSSSASSNGAKFPAESAFSNNTAVYSSDGRFSAANSRQPVVATPPDLQETVDDLRAEMALTRAAVQSYKARLQQNNL